MTRVVNIKFDNFDINIGRQKGTNEHFGNPFSHYENSIATVKVATKEESVQNFIEWLDGNPKWAHIEPERRLWILDNLETLRGKRLGCYCKTTKNELCHGDEYVRRLNLQLKMKLAIKLAIIGSRSYNDYERLKQVLKDKYWDSEVGWKISEIVSGKAKGADFLGAMFSRENGIKLTEFAPDWEKDGKGAGFKRNWKIIQAADEVLAAWDGQSKGTQHSLSIAKKLKKTTLVIYF